MAKRSPTRRVSIPDIKKEDTGKSPKTVRLVCILGTGKKTTKGTVTGKEYIFTGNQPTEVDELDAVEMLSRRRGGCCGNLPTKIFDKVE